MSPTEPLFRGGRTSILRWVISLSILYHTFTDALNTKMLQDQTFEADIAMGIGRKFELEWICFVSADPSPPLGDPEVDGDRNFSSSVFSSSTSSSDTSSVTIALTPTPTQSQNSTDPAGGSGNNSNGRMNIGAIAGGTSWKIFE